MKIAVRYYTKTGNTKRLAEAIGEAVGAEALPISTPMVIKKGTAIKLKELRLQTADSEGTTKKKMDVTVTLHANGSGANPISSVVFTPTGTEECDGVIYNSDDGLTLTTAYSMLLGHFIPHGVTKLILTSTYDVYDKNVTTEHLEGNLIRKDCKATNTIPLSVIDRFSEASRGTRYTINMTIKPTYLYMLSDPDLNNPSVEIES